MMSDYNVDTINNGLNEFNVKFHGPKESLFEGRVWKIHVELPDAYPYKSPSVGFVNKIFHPNVDEYSGFVCLDDINQSWSPMFGILFCIAVSFPNGFPKTLGFLTCVGVIPIAADLVNVFEVFLPQLLLYPNPSDPLNGDASSLIDKKYDQKVKEYCEQYVKRENITKSPVEERSDEDEDEDITEEESWRISSDDDIAGHVDA